MNFIVEDTFIRDVKIIHPKESGDFRGFFMEVFNVTSFKTLNLPTEFVQMNHSRSRKNVVRGLHFQWDPPMGKLMRITRGEGYLVAVDIRKNSPTFGKFVGRTMSEDNKIQMWAPAGCARGFCALSDIVEVQYLITGEWNRYNESEILWNDSDIAIPWPVEKPILSVKDEMAQTLKQWNDSPNSHKFPYDNYVL